MYAPDEMLDRAVLDNQGLEIGIIKELLKVKRTYRALRIKTRLNIQMQYGVEDYINIPISALSKTRERLDEVVLSRGFDKVLQLPSFGQVNDDEADFESEC